MGTTSELVSDFFIASGFVILVVTSAMVSALVTMTLGLVTVAAL